MKLFLIIAETRFYQPNFVADFLRKTSDEVVGAILVTKAPPKAELNSYLIKNIKYLNIFEIIKLGYLMIKSILLDYLIQPTKSGNFYSVKSVLKTFGVNYFEVQNSINKPEILEKIRSTQPDIIISSNPLIFKDELLAIPRICCLNRHSSLLPAFGGLWPVFHAVKKNESETGVSIHLMVTGIDKGTVLAQHKVPIYKGDSVSSLYDITFRLSSVALLEALKKVNNKDFSEVVNNKVTSYYSSPTSEDWKEFRSVGGKF